MIRREAGMICPQCKQFCYRLSNGHLSSHLTDRFYPFSNRKIQCVYSRAPITDAEQGITPIRRRAMDREAKS